MSGRHRGYLHDTYLQTIQGSKLVADSRAQSSPRSGLECVDAGTIIGLVGTCGRRGNRAALSSLRTSSTEKNDLAAAFQRASDVGGSSNRLPLRWLAT